MYSNNMPCLSFYHPSNFNQQLQSQFGGQPPHPQLQRHVPNILHQHHDKRSLFTSNVWPFPLSTIGSSPRTAQAAAVDASSTPANSCGASASDNDEDLHERFEAIDFYLCLEIKGHISCKMNLTFIGSTAIGFEQSRFPISWLHHCHSRSRTFGNRIDL